MPPAPELGFEIPIDLAALLRSPGTRRDVEVDIRVDAVGTTAAVIERVTGTLSAEALGEALSVAGTLTVTWTGGCRRCLDPARGTSEAELREIYEKVAVEGETYPLPADERLDLAPMVIEQALLELPLAPLCDDDCAGPLPDAFAVAVETLSDEEPESDPVRDPRWAVLDEVAFDDD